jgi:hypothetical protein
MRVAPNGDIFLTEPQSGRVKVLRPSKDGTKAETVETFAQGLLLPFGVQFHPAGAQPKWVYIAETNRVVRYAYKVGDTKASSVPEVVVPELSPVGGGHFTRDVAFSLDGKRMFVSWAAVERSRTMPKKSAAEIKEWEGKHGLGAAWGNEENRAGVMVFDVGEQARQDVRHRHSQLRGPHGAAEDRRPVVHDERARHARRRPRARLLHAREGRRLLRLAVVLHGQERRPAPQGRPPGSRWQGHRSGRALPGALRRVASRSTAAGLPHSRRNTGDGFAVLHGRGIARSRPQGRACA